LFRARNLLKERLLKYAEQFGYRDIRGRKQSEKLEEEE
jgi:hypothetical protein